MTPEEYRAELAKAMTEDQLLAAVLGTPRKPGLALALGWLGYHTHRSQHSPAGFPDLCLARRGRLVFAELKRERRGKRDDPTPAQNRWLFALEDVAADSRADALIARRANDPVLSVHVWRPSDLLDGTIERVLRVSQ